jgi:hypothetical protein
VRWLYQIGITVPQKNAVCAIVTTITRPWAWKFGDEDCRVSRVRDRPLCVRVGGLYPSPQSRSTYPISRGFRAQRSSEIDGRKRALCRPVASPTAGVAAAGLGCDPGCARTGDHEASSGRGVSAVPIASPACFSRCSVSMARACALSALRTMEPRQKRHSHSRGYVLIAAISGPGPMMLMTRVRL